MIIAKLQRGKTNIYIFEKMQKKTKKPNYMGSNAYDF